MRLGDLAPDFSLSPADQSIEISDISLDSRTVTAGALFAAMPGSHLDGMGFAAAAVDAGAAAVLGQEKHDGFPPGVPALRAANPRQKLAQLAARFYPKQPATIAAITGTAGKTSVADFLRQLWIHAGSTQSASIGTLGIVRPDGETYGSLTTPDPVSLHRSLAILAEEGVDHLSLEASSHGLDQFRLDGVRLTAAAFTNLGRDHMDYHPTIDAYLAAKARLFTELLPMDAVAIMEPDAPFADRMIAVCADHGRAVRTVGVDGDLIALRARRVDQRHSAQELELAVNGREAQVVLPLLGRFQVSNALIAAGLALETGADTDAVLDGLNHLVGAPGRLQLIGTRAGVRVFVDYAHKPDAIAEVLQTLRPVAQGRLSIVVGAGGDRDRGKRPLMGRAAAENADRVYITDDNPRSENPAAIRHAILAACPAATEIADRADAIRQAVSDATSGDIVVIAGKGHERGQIVGDTELPFSDIELVGSILSDSGD